jgi:serine/threonine protein kinase
VPPAFDGPVLRDRWQLGPRLGSGSQGRTYLARDLKAADPTQTVVVKQYKLEGGWKRFELFERETKVLRSLRHPGIPRVLDDFEEPAGTFYLVLAKAPGATLRAIARKVRFTEEELVDVTRRVLDILEFLHALKPPVIHRDLKPANLLRASDGTVSVVDFGGVTNSLREEGGSTVVGTFGYMAPEVLHGAATPATDLYSLGATIVSLAAGVEPEKIPRKGLRMDLRRHLPGTAPGLVHFLERLTDPDPDERPATAREARRLLDDALRPSPEKRPASEPPRAPVPLLAPAVPRSMLRREEPADGLGVYDDTKLPLPLRLLHRMTLFIVGFWGFIAMTVGLVAVVPLVFVTAKVLTPKERRPRVGAAEEVVKQSLRDGRRGFLSLQRRAFQRNPTRSLPPGRRR